MKPIRKFFRERRGMDYGSADFGCVGGAFGAFVGSGAGLCSFATVDSAYLTREPWQNVPVTEFRAMVLWAITKSMPTRTIIVCILR